MTPLYKFVSNAAFALNLLLAFFLLFEDHVVVPAWLQAAGRMHPLLLHLPIGFLLLLALLPLLQKTIGREAFYQTQVFVLALACGSAALTALMGFLLAREPAYDGPLLSQHKWTGILLSWLTYGLFLWLKKRPSTKLVFQIGLGVSIVLLIIAGHLGANITHGEGFILAPVQGAPEEVAVTEETSVYEALIVPVFQQKCFSCHNQRKAKGGLVMTEAQRFRKGGDNGAPWLAGDAGQSLLIQRLELPSDQEEHMPPDGKPQLNATEIQLLKDWIDSGADMEQAIGTLAVGHPLQDRAMELLAAAQAPIEKHYEFSPAPEAVIAKLNIPFRTVSPLAVGSPALRAAIFVRETYEPEFLEELLKVKEQLVELKLDHLPVKDEELAVIGQFANLEVLYLNNTEISGKALSPLGNCTQLRSLALSGTPVDSSVQALLGKLPALRELYVWNTALDSSTVAVMEKKFPAVNFQLGYTPVEEELLALSPPEVKRSINLDGLEEVQLTHNFPGAAIRFTIDGTEPDSVSSPAYEEPLLLNHYAVIKARAFRDGWLGSKSTTTTYFPRSIPLKKAVLASSPDPKYQGSGAYGLIDSHKGFVNNLQSPLWLGYRERALEALFFPENPQAMVTTITLSYLQNIGAYLMPPATVEIWGGADPEHLQLIKSYRPEQPVEYRPNEIKGLDISIPASSWACYKIVAQPVPSLPAWHKAKGQRGWIFLDEVYFYDNASAALVPQPDVKPGAQLEGR